MSCERCGRCCMEVGRAFWKVGNLTSPHPFGEIDELNTLATNGDHEDGGLPCEMFEIVGGKAICKIHRDFGYAAKPITCRQYPDFVDMCFREEALATA